MPQAVQSRDGRKKVPTTPKVPIRDRPCTPGSVTDLRHFRRCWKKSRDLPAQAGTLSRRRAWPAKIMATFFMVVAAVAFGAVVAYITMYVWDREEFSELFWVSYWSGRRRWIGGQRGCIEVRNLGRLWWASQNGCRITPVTDNAVSLQYYLKEIGVISNTREEEFLHVGGAGLRTALMEVYTEVTFRQGGSFRYVSRSWWQPVNGYEGYCCSYCGSTESENPTSCACGYCHAV